MWSCSHGTFRASIFLSCRGKKTDTSQERSGKAFVTDHCCITTLVEIHLQCKGSHLSGENIRAHFSQRQVTFETNVSFPAGYRASMYCYYYICSITPQKEKRNFLVTQRFRLVLFITDFPHPLNGYGAIKVLQQAANPKII